MLVFSVLCFFALQVSFTCGNVLELEPNHLFKVESSTAGLLKIFCYSGGSKALHRIWESVQLQLSLSDGFEQFDGHSPDEVRSKYNEQKSSWNIFNNVYSFKKRQIRLSPFNRTCVGIFTNKEYLVQLNKIRVDYWKVGYLVAGVVLFLYSPRLAKNSAFYYITGTSVGSVALLLFLVYLLSRLFPKKPVMYTVLAGGSSVVLYLIQLFWENMRVVLTEYKSYFITSITLTSLISFVICYRFGPVSDPRSINLIQWTLQLFGLVLIFICSEFQEASIAIIIVLLTLYMMPKWLFRSAVAVWMRKLSRPKPRELLTEDQFHEQSVVETNKALDHLRDFCSSPECNQWRTVLRLKDPLRFAKFVQGSSHLTDDEVLAFETSHNKTLYSDEMTDDDSDIE